MMVDIYVSGHYVPRTELRLLSSFQRTLETRCHSDFHSRAEKTEVQRVQKEEAVGPGFEQLHESGSEQRMQGLAPTRLSGKGAEDHSRLGSRRTLRPGTVSHPGHLAVWFQWQTCSRAGGNPVPRRSHGRIRKKPAPPSLILPGTLWRPSLVFGVGRCL